MSLTGLDIVIVGGGIAGLAAALALRARGANVCVLEQADAIREVGAGLQISPNGFAVLDALGLSNALQKVATRAEAVSLRDYRRSGEVMRLDLARYAADQQYLFLHRADLIALLVEAARAAGVELRLLQEVVRVEQGKVHLKTGAVARGDLIIGADGVHSVFRGVLNGQTAPFFTGQVAWRALVDNRTGVPNEARVFMGPGRHVVSYPLRQGQSVNLVAVQERADWAAEGWHHQDDPENLRAAFADFRGPAADLLADVRQVGLWGLFRHPVAERWHGEGLALLGDAAHPTLPFLAQGANMALEDAWVLADALDGATRMEQGLATYQSRRRDRVVRVIETANGNAWKYHLRFGPLRRAAHLALSLGGRVAPARVVRQFDWLYRHDVTA
ncbi:FAD-dependent oxidoreductase [Thalassococcus sp. S3]|uniref:FAD-dependent oxidoreductase n=1 Tax=Thalassococcus sp. S3 TaxID=2017482 RepID=UPI001024857C|nr:FAD-dependent oxidoreductase [Thalassococcus sp. S3]QBF31565.1 monooxygenase [Thalassococcus sp. S3]